MRLVDKGSAGGVLRTTRSGKVRNGRILGSSERNGVSKRKVAMFHSRACI